jgi:hypothetical protein
MSYKWNNTLWPFVSGLFPLSLNLGLIHFVACISTTFLSWMGRFWDRISLCSPGWPWTQNSASASRVLGIIGICYHACLVFLCFLRQGLSLYPRLAWNSMILLPPHFRSVPPYPAHHSFLMDEYFHCMHIYIYALQFVYPLIGIWAGSTFFVFF